MDTGVRRNCVAGLVALSVYVIFRVAGESRPEAQDAAASAGPSLATVAVLPFENISTDPTDEVFTAGFHDELLSRLSKIAGLRVILRTSVIEYEGRRQNLREIAERLGVGSVVEGSVR